MVGADGQPVYWYGLRYWGEKDGAELSMIKALPDAMVPVARRAVLRALSLTEEARRVARHQHQYGTTTLGPPWDDLPADHLIQDEEITEALGLTTGDAVDREGEKFIVNNRVPYVKMIVKDARGATRVAWCVTKAALYEALHKRSFHGACRPRVDRKIRLHRLLFVVNTGLNRDFRGTRGTVNMMSYSSVRTFLGKGDVEVGPPSVFERLGLLHEGRPVRVRPHQPRILLNTLAQRCGLGDVQLARWMGRRQIAVNAAYDGRSGPEGAEGVRRRLEAMGAVAPLNTTEHRPLPEREYTAQDGAPMLVTEIGACAHDYAQAPCAAHTRMVRGWADGTVELPSPAERERLAGHVGAQLAAALAEERNGTAGADAWVAADQEALTVLSGIAEADRRAS